MSKGRFVPGGPAARAAQMTLERRGVCLNLDPDQLRAWAARWDVPLLPCSDDELIATMHRARMLDEAMSPAARLVSIGILAAQGDVLAQTIQQHLQPTKEV